MSEGKIPGKTLADKPEEVKPPTVSEEMDFKLYLDAVNSASQRTRSTIYVLVAIVVLTITAYRNTSNPDWISSRLAHLQLASACLKRHEKGPYPTNCQAAIDYSKTFIFTERTDEVLFDNELKRELEEQITAFIRTRTEALSLRLPFFGVVIDMNDLGMVTGLFLTFVLYVLFAGLTREVDSLNRSMTKAVEGTTKQAKERLELLLMTQVLASRKGVTVGVHILLIGAVLIHGFVVWEDWVTAGAAIALQGHFRGTWETRIDLILFGIVAFLALWCWRGQRGLDRKVDDLINQLHEKEALLQEERRTQPDGSETAGDS